MELTLRYRGELAANGSKADKHDIRLQLHKQLEVFWHQDSRLKRILDDLGQSGLKGLQLGFRGPRNTFAVSRPIVGMRNFFWRYPLAGYDFVPLVSYVREIRCHLNIRLYRRVDQDGFLFVGGDIDNRLKTFFDALQVPSHEDQVPEPSTLLDPKDWPTIFCLLDDDKAITKFSIESIGLLTPVPEHVKRPENYAELEIDVSVIPVTPMQGSVELLFP